MNDFTRWSNSFWPWNTAYLSSRGFSERALLGHHVVGRCSRGWVSGSRYTIHGPHTIYCVVIITVKAVLTIQVYLHLCINASCFCSVQLRSQFTSPSSSSSSSSSSIHRSVKKMYRAPCKSLELFLPMLRRAGSANKYFKPEVSECYRVSIFEWNFQRTF